MQIVTSAVRIDVALALSRRRSLLAPPNSCGTLVVFVHADAQCLCAAGACPLSEQHHWARLRPSPQRGLNLGRGYDRCPSTRKLVSSIAEDDNHFQSFPFLCFSFFMTGACPYLHKFATESFWTNVHTRESSQDAAGLLSWGPRVLARHCPFFGHGGVWARTVPESVKCFCFFGGLVVCLLHFRILVCFKLFWDGQ